MNSQTQPVERPFRLRFAGLFNFTYFKTKYFILKLVIIVITILKDKIKLIYFYLILIAFN